MTPTAKHLEVPAVIQAVDGTSCCALKAGVGATLPGRGRPSLPTFTLSGLERALSSPEAGSTAESARKRAPGDKAGSGAEHSKPGDPDTPEQLTADSGVRASSMNNRKL
jgi:hypothetical protein